MRRYDCPDCRDCTTCTARVRQHQPTLCERAAVARRPTISGAGMAKAKRAMHELGRFDSNQLAAKLGLTRNAAGRYITQACREQTPRVRVAEIIDRPAGGHALYIYEYQEAV